MTGLQLLPLADVTVQLRFIRLGLAPNDLTHAPGSSLDLPVRALYLCNEDYERVPNNPDIMALQQHLRTVQVTSKYRYVINLGGLLSSSVLRLRPADRGPVLSRIGQPPKTIP